MKKTILSHIFFLMVFAALFSFAASKSHALFFPGPGDPTLDAPTDVTFTLKNVGAYASTASSAANNVMQEQVKYTKALKKKYTDKYSGISLGGGKDKKKKAVPASKTIKKTKVADIYKPTSVKKAFYKLFLAYPDTKEEVNAAYRAKATEFFNDTIIEIYTSVRELEKEMAELTASVNNLTNDLVTGDGGNGAEAGDDNNGAWKNAYIAYDTMNKLLMVTEELVAMRAQYEAALALKDYITPVEKKSKKTSSVLINKNLLLADNVTSSSVRSNKSTLVFAQMTEAQFRQSSATPAASANTMIQTRASSSDTKITAQPASITSFAQQRRDAVVEKSRNEALGMFKTQDTLKAEAAAAQALEEAAAVEDDDDDYEYDPATDGPVTFVTSEAPNIASPFEGNREKMEELNKLDPLYTMATEGLEIHNLIQSLPQFRDIFEKYENYQKLHAKSLEMLKASDQCVLQYLGRYYADPEKVWSGGPIGENVNNYDLRTGVSGWAIQTFEAAKAEETSPVDTNDFTEIELDTNFDTGDLTNIEQQKELIKAQKFGSGFNNPSKDKEIEAINRETSMLAWKIGAEAAKALAQDQYSETPKWGEAQTKFPIWNDQKNFYNQYLEGKYGNIKQYLTAMEFNQIAVNIAKEINSITPQKAEIKNYNARELGKLETVVTAMVKAEEENKGKEIPDEELQALKDKRAAEIKAAEEKRDAALKPYITQRDELYRQLDVATQALNTYNQRINQLKNEALKADVEAETMSDQLDYINEVEAYGKEDDNADTITIKKQETFEKAIAPVSQTVEELTPASSVKSNSFRTSPLKSYNRSALDNDLRMAVFKSSETLAFAAATRAKLTEEKGLVLETKTYSRTVETEQKVISDEDSVQQAYAKKAINEGKSTSANKEAEVKRYQSLAATQKTKIQELQQKIDELEPVIERINTAYAEDVSKIEEAYNNSVEIARQKIADENAEKAAKSLLSIYNGSVESNSVGDLIGSSYVKAIIGQSEGLINDTKSYAAEAVDKALGDMYKLGDHLYLPSSGKIVEKRHAELMDELREIPLDKLVQASTNIKAMSGAPAITTALTTLFQQALINDACADDYCKVADKEYFIGLLPKSLDFSAPKAAPDMYMPPLREIVHFDDIDYKNIAKTADGSITRDGFLNYGAEIPAVWQLILKDKAFVERDVDLNSILEVGDGREAFFMRGGRYPCRLDGKIIDVDPYDGQYMVVSSMEKGTSTGGNSTNSKAKEFLKKIGVYVQEKTKSVAEADVSLPQCQEIELVGNDGIAAKFYYTVRDINADTEGPAAIQPSETMGNPSELGTLLKPLNTGIRFTDKPQEVFERLIEIEKEIENSDKEYKTNLKDEIFKNAPYDTNQFGDFLSFVEIEMTYRQTLEELKVNVEDAKKTLFDALAKVGFTPTDDFNLAKEADYNLAKSNLKRLKNNLVEEGFNGIAGVNYIGNEIVEERLNKIKSIFTALRKDKDELINLSEVSPSDSELDEMIKTEEVNQKVVGEYKKKADEEFKKQLENFIRPFCAAY